MKNTLLSLLLFSLFQMVYLPSFSQQKETHSYKNSITFNVFRPILREVRFGYEKQFNERDMFSATVGIQYPSSSNSFQSLPWVNLPFYYTVSHGGYLGMAYNYFFSVRHHFYLSDEVYFAAYFYDHKNYNNGSGMDMDLYEAQQSMKLMKTGIKFLVGKKVFLFSMGKVGLQLDFFFGFGVQYRYEKKTVFKDREGGPSSQYVVYDPPKDDISKGLLPTLHGGILICVLF